MGYNPFDNIQAHTMTTQSRIQRYADFDQMEYTPEIASALDIYADEMTTHTSIKKMLNINTENSDKENPKKEVLDEKVEEEVLDEKE